MASLSDARCFVLAILIVLLGEVVFAAMDMNAGKFTFFCLLGRNEISKCRLTISIAASMYILCLTNLKNDALEQCIGCVR